MAQYHFLCLLGAAYLVQLVLAGLQEDLNLPFFSETDLRREQKLKTQRPAVDHRGEVKAGDQRAVDCHEDNTFIDFATRLIGCDGRLSPQAGILQIYYKNAWGTVCDDYFNNMDAQVACYGLGFRRSEGLYYMHPGHFNPPPYAPDTLTILDDMQCNGTEAFIDHCKHAVWTEHNCFPNEDINIACSATGPEGKYGYATRKVNTHDNDTDVGRLEIFHNGVWGTVCDDEFDDVDAGVACRSLNQGYATGIQVFDKELYGRGEGKIWIDSLLCTSGDYNIGNCAHDPWGLHDCNHEEDAMIRCGQCFDVHCQNGGRCRDAETKDCECPQFYSGQYCEIAHPCSSSPCLHGATCRDTCRLDAATCRHPTAQWVDLSYECDCLPGTTGALCETLLPSSTGTTVTEPTTTVTEPTTTVTEPTTTVTEATTTVAQETTTTTESPIVTAIVGQFAGVEEPFDASNEKVDHEINELDARLPSNAKENLKMRAHRA